jgi:hypothetical protein
LNGGQDSPLLTPGVIALRWGASVEESQRPFEFRASLDLPLLLRVSEASLPEEAATHPLGFLPAVDLGAAWWITSAFAASLGGSLILELVRVQEPALERDRERRLQAVVEAGLHLRPSRHAGFGLEGSVPVGGNLGGDAWSIGLYGRFEY